MWRSHYHSFSTHFHPLLSNGGGSWTCDSVKILPLLWATTMHLFGTRLLRRRQYNNVKALIPKYEVDSMNLNKSTWEILGEDIIVKFYLVSYCSGWVCFACQIAETKFEHIELYVKLYGFDWQLRSILVYELGQSPPTKEKLESRKWIFTSSGRYDAHIQTSFCILTHWSLAICWQINFQIILSYGLYWPLTSRTSPLL